MMALLTTWSSLFLTTLITPQKHLWTLVTAQSFLIATLSIKMIHSYSYNDTGSLLHMDKFSTPFVILTCWLLPLTILATQGKIILEPFMNQRAYMLISIFLQLTTLLAFSTSDLMLFFLFFEASLVPTMIIIVRWGTQEQRLQAGLYLAFYTLVGAAPMMTWLIHFYIFHGSLHAPMSSNMFLTQATNDYPMLFWLALNLAFLIKLPLFCLHLWLPQAHVEASLGGSMILAGTLLKLGGYGILRTASLFLDNTLDQVLLIMFVAILGILAASMFCSRQSDMKTLIAMSSVSHMNLVVVAALISTETSYAGAIGLMIAHGLTSSLLFNLADTHYQRIHSRSMLLLRGSLIIIPIVGAWWMLAILFNLAIPPSINFIADTMTLLTIWNWSAIAFLLVALNLIFTTLYTLYLLWSTQRGLPPSHMKTLPPMTARESLLLLLHVTNLIMLVLVLKTFL